MNKIYHPYHLVNFSPWPYLVGSSVILITTGLVLWFHYKFTELLLCGLILFTLFFTLWIKDVIRESTYQGFHNITVISGLKIGFILFIISEVLFFFSFFWAFFHSSLSPAIDIGYNWPPLGIEVLDPFSIPLLNTCILLSSGITVTWSHYSIINKNRGNAVISLTLTCILGVIFTTLQGCEYLEASFCFADSVYGSVFFLATGFHGLHVLIGTVFLLVCLWRLFRHHFSNFHHFGFEAASWYWHFVDVVWLFLYVFVYWWGS